MTEYTKSKKVLELEKKMRDVQVQGHFARQVQAMSTNPEGEPLIGAHPFIKLAEQELEWVTNRVERIQRDIDAERALFDTDRARLQRAFRAMRKAGFNAILNETPYESVADSKLKVDTDALDAEYVFAYSNHMKYAFERTDRRGWYGRGYDSTDTLNRHIYLHWGNNGNKDVAKLAIQLLKAEGLRVKWDGSGADCIEVSSATDSQEVAA